MFMLETFDLKTVDLKTAYPKTVNPDGVPMPGQMSPWHTHPKPDPWPFFDTPMAGSSSLSIVSSPKIGSIGKGRKITTMQQRGPAPG